MFGLDLLRATHHAGRGLANVFAEIGAARQARPRDFLEAAHRLAGAAGSVARAHDLAITVRGHVPRGRALVVANHISYLDPIAILPHCPALPLSKGEVASWPVIGTLASALGVMFVARDKPAARIRVLRRVHDRLAAGVPVLNFPEGTTTPGDDVGPFWRGTFGIAQRLGVPVVPVAIHYPDREAAWCGGAAFLPHYLRMASRRRIDVTLAFCAPMLPRTGESPEAMAARARFAIKCALNEMRNHAGLRRQLSSPRSDTVLPPARVA